MPSSASARRAPSTATSARSVPACRRRAPSRSRPGSRRAGPTLLIEWTNAKKGRWPALSLYPGDDLVDLWGVHYYDTGPEKNTQAVWDKYYNITYNGGPWGLGTWLAAAKAHHQKLGIGGGG